MMYSVGDPSEAKQQDRKFDSIQEAETVAKDMSRIEQKIYAIRNEEGLVVSLAEDGRVFIS
jgi:hypothetical protein